MHLIMKYLCSCFENSEKALRMLRKVKSVADYDRAIRFLFNECAFLPDPVFQLSILLS